MKDIFWNVGGTRQQPLFLNLLHVKQISQKEEDHQDSEGVITRKFIVKFHLDDEIIERSFAVEDFRDDYLDRIAEYLGIYV